MTKSPDAVCHIARSIYVNRCFFFLRFWFYYYYVFDFGSNVVDVFVRDAFAIAVVVCSKL